MNKKINKFFLYTFFLTIIINFGHPATPQLLKEKGLSDNLFGPMFAFMSVGFLIGSLLWGSLSDKYSRKFILLIPWGLFYGTGQLMIALSTSTEMLLIARVIGGFGASAFFVVGIALLSEYASKEAKTRVQTTFLAINTLGLGIGYLIGGLIADAFNATDLFKYQAYLIFVLSIFGLLLITKTPKTLSKLPYLKNLALGLKNIKSEKFIAFFIATLPFLMVKVTLGKWVDVFVLEDLGYSKLTLGLYVAVGGIITTTVSIIWAKKIINRFNDFNIIKFMVFIQMMSIVGATTILYLNTSMTAAFFAAMLAVTWTVAWTFTNGAILSIITKTFKNQAGTVTGVQLIIQQTGSIIASFTAGTIRVSAGSIILFYVYAGISLIAFILFLPLGKQYIKMMKSNKKMSV